MQSFFVLLGTASAIFSRLSGIFTGCFQSLFQNLLFCSENTYFVLLFVHGDEFASAEKEHLLINEHCIQYKTQRPFYENVSLLSATYNMSNLGSEFLELKMAFRKCNYRVNTTISNNNIKHLNSTYYMQGPVLSVLYMLTYLILTTNNNHNNPLRQMKK